MPELPNLPLGLSMREHMANYMDEFKTGLIGRFTEVCDAAQDEAQTAEADRVLEIITAIHDDLESLLQFIDAENAFYHVDAKRMKPGVHSMRVHQPRKRSDGKVVIQVDVAIGENTVASPSFEPDSAELLAGGILRAVEKAKEIR